MKVRQLVDDVKVKYFETFESDAIKKMQLKKYRRQSDVKMQKVI